jgi:hypothetical protein
MRFHSWHNGIVIAHGIISLLCSLGWSSLGFRAFSIPSLCFATLEGLRNVVAMSVYLPTVAFCWHLMCGHAHMTWF